MQKTTVYIQLWKSFSRRGFILVDHELKGITTAVSQPESSSFVLSAGVSPRVGIMGDCSEKTGKHRTVLKLRLH